MAADLEPDFTQAELIDEWHKLYRRDIPPMLGEGERTYSTIQEETQIDFKTAKRLVTEWLAEGIIVSVGKRRSTRGQTVEAFKMVKKVEGKE